MQIEHQTTAFEMRAVLASDPNNNMTAYDNHCDKIWKNTETITSLMSQRKMDGQFHHLLLNHLNDPLVYMNVSNLEDDRMVNMMQTLFNFLLEVDEELYNWIPVLNQLNVFQVQKIPKTKLTLDEKLIGKFIERFYSIKAQKQINYDKQEFLNKFENIFKKLKSSSKLKRSIIQKITEISPKTNDRYRLASLYGNLSQLNKEKLDMLGDVSSSNFLELHVPAACDLLSNSSFVDERVTKMFITNTFSSMTKKRRHPNVKKLIEKKTFLLMIAKVLAKESTSPELRAWIMNVLDNLVLNLKRVVTNKNENRMGLTRLMAEMLNILCGFLNSRSKDNDFEGKYGLLKPVIFKMIFYLLIDNKTKERLYESLMGRLESTYGGTFIDFLMNKLDKVDSVEELNDFILAKSLSYCVEGVFDNGRKDRLLVLLNKLLKKDFSSKDKIAESVIYFYYGLSMKVLEQGDSSLFYSFLKDCLSKKWFINYDIDISAAVDLCGTTDFSGIRNQLVTVLKDENTLSIVRENERKESKLFKGIMRCILNNNDGFSWFFDQMRKNKKDLNFEMAFVDSKEIQEEDLKSSGMMQYIINNLPKEMIKNYFKIIKPITQNLIIQTILGKQLDNFSEYTNIIKAYLRGMSENKLFGEIENILCSILNKLKGDFDQAYSNNYKTLINQLSFLNIIVFNQDFVILSQNKNLFTNTINFNVSVIDYIDSNKIFDGYLFKLMTSQLSFSLFYKDLSNARKVLTSEFRQAKSIYSFYFQRKLKQKSLQNLVNSYLDNISGVAAINNALRVHEKTMIRWLLLLIENVPKINIELFKILLSVLNDRLTDYAVESSMVNNINRGLHQILNRWTEEDFNNHKDNIDAVFREFLGINKQFTIKPVMSTLLESMSFMLSKNTDIESKMSFIILMIVFMIKKTNYFAEGEESISQGKGGMGLASILPLIYKLGDYKGNMKIIRETIVSLQKNDAVLQNYFTRLQLATLVNVLLTARKEATIISKQVVTDVKEISKLKNVDNCIFKFKYSDLIVRREDTKNVDNYQVEVDIKFFQKLVDRVKDSLKQKELSFTKYKHIFFSTLKKMQVNNFLKLFISDELNLLVRIISIADKKSQSQIIDYLNKLLKKDSDDLEKLKIIIFACIFVLRSTKRISLGFDSLLLNYFEFLYSSFKIRHFDILFIYTWNNNYYNPQLNKTLFKFLIDKNHNRYTMMGLLFARDLDSIFNPKVFGKEYMSKLQKLKYSNQNSIVFCLKSLSRYFRQDLNQRFKNKGKIDDGLNQFYLKGILQQIEVSSSNFDIFVNCFKSVNNSQTDKEHLNSFLLVVNKLLDFMESPDEQEQSKKSLLLSLGERNFILTGEAKTSFYKAIIQSTNNYKRMYSQSLILLLFLTNYEVENKEEFNQFCEFINLFLKRLQVKTKPYFEKQLNHYLKNQTPLIFELFIDQYEQSQSKNPHVFYHFFTTFKFAKLELVNRFFTAFESLINSEHDESTKAKLKGALNDYTYLRSNFLNLEDVSIDQKLVDRVLAEAETKFAYHA